MAAFAECALLICLIAKRLNKFNGFDIDLDKRIDFGVFCPTDPITDTDMRHGDKFALTVQHVRKSPSFLPEIGKMNTAFQTIKTRYHHRLNRP